MSETGRERLTNAICVCGTGRSGTTIFFQVLGSHRDLGWVSNYLERAPKYPVISALTRVRGLGAMLNSSAAIQRYIPRPAESVQTLRFCSDGVFQSPKELKEEDVPPRTVERVTRYHRKVLIWQGQRRLAIKHTGFPRFRFWRLILGDPKFVHVIRDGRAVAYSMMRVSWWDGTLNSWWWGPMPENYLEEYERYGRRPAVLAAIVWKRLLDIYESEAADLTDLPIVTVRYDQFATDPVHEMQKVAKYCDLSFTPEFEKAIRRFRVRNADSAWKDGLSREDIDAVETVLAQHLHRYGFV